MQMLHSKICTLLTSPTATQIHIYFWAN